MFTFKRQRALILMGLVALVAALPLTALAAPVGPRGAGDGPQRLGHEMILRFIENPEVREAANITDEQIDQLQDIHRQAETQAIPLRADAEVIQLELQALWDEDDPDADAIHEKIDALSEVQANLQHAYADARLAAKDVLTPEQIEAVRTAARERFQDMRNNRAERRETRRDGQGFGQGRPQMNGQGFRPGGQAGFGPGPQGPQGGRGFGPGPQAGQGAPDAPAPDQG